MKKKFINTIAQFVSDILNAYFILILPQILMIEILVSACCYNYICFFCARDINICKSFFLVNICNRIRKK